MKKFLLLAFIPLFLFSCHEGKKPGKEVPPTAPATVIQPDATTPSTAVTEAKQPIDTFVRDTTAPLGTPQNPLVVEPGKPLDLSALFNNREKRSLGERLASNIDSISEGAKKGDINLMFYYGVCFEQGWGVKQDYKQAFEWYEKASKHGQKYAYGALGGLYRTGHGTSVDAKKSFECFLKGAEQQDENSMLCVGNCYYTGFGVEKNLEQAAQWWKKAADLDNGFALSQMGDAYYGGLGIEKDLDKAVEYYKKAVEKNIPNAQYRLGVLSFYGEGVEKDETYAKLLLTKARNNNVPQADEFLVKHFE